MRVMTISDEAEKIIEQSESLSTWDALIVGLEAAITVIEQYIQAYPTDIFPEPPTGQHGITVDACSASALRHVLPNIIEDIRKLAE